MHACMHAGVIVNDGIVRRNGGWRGWTRLSERRRQEVEVNDENNVVDGDGVAIVKIGIIPWDCPKPPKVYRQRGNGNGLSSEQIGMVLYPTWLLREVLPNLSLTMIDRSCR